MTRKPPIKPDTLYLDLADDDFCRLVWDSDDKVLGLETPDGEDQYETFEDMDEFHPSEYVRVEEQAVEDPAGFIEDFLTQAENAETVSLAHPELRASFRWARRHTKVVETTEDDDE